MAVGDSGKIVIVGDEGSMRDYLSEVLSREGYECACFEGSVAALTYMSESGPQPKLVLTDIKMPGMSGIDLLRTIKTVSPDLPVILVSGVYELTLAIESLKSGASDCLFKPTEPQEIAALAAKHLKSNGGSQQDAMWLALGRFLASRDHGRAPAEQVQEVFDVLGLKQYETLQHAKRVAAYSLALGKACRLSTQELKRLELGALLHDIGKMAIPHNVLMKQGPLNEEELAVMRLHPRIGWEILREFPELGSEAEIVYSHHERFDGKGYPRGLQGERIPLGARVFAIADTIDAMTVDRPYRRALPMAAARAEIRKHAGTQFDSRLAGLFLGLPESLLEQIRSQHPDDPAPAVLAEPEKAVRSLS